MATYMNQTNSGRIIVQQTNPTAIIVQPDNERKIILKGSGGLKGETGDAATITVGSTTTGEPGTSASVVNSGTSSDAVLDFVIPKGSKGDKGDTGATGATGPANTLSIGTVQGGETADATITGDAPNQTLNLTLPKGDKGDTGAQGPAGAGVVAGGSTGQVLTKKSGTDYDTEWATPTTYSDFTGATSSVAGSHGLVPAPTTSDPDKFLKGDGTWGTPPGTTYTAGEGIEINSNTIAAKVRRVYDYYTARPASANTTATGNGGMFTFQATNSMTTGKPKNDASILQLEWDNNAGHDTQLAMTPGVHGSWLAHRHQNSGTWGSWIYVLDDVAGSVKTANIDALAVTTAKVADGAITEAKIDATAWAKKVNVASIDLTGETTTLLSLTKALGTNNIDYARWECRTDIGAANISDKPTGYNASFVCEAYCNRWTASNDYRYQLICWVKENNNPFVAYIANHSSSITWERLRPTVNDATLTITQSGSTLGTFSANASSNVTIDVPGGGSSYAAGVGIEIANDTIEVDDTVALIDDPATSETPTPWVETSMIENGAVTPEKASFTTYSTTETRVGTWIDGKPLYRKVVQFTSPSSAYTFTQVATGITNADYAFIENGAIKNTAEGWSIQINSARGTSDNAMMNWAVAAWVRLQPNATNFAVSVAGGLNDQPMWVSVLYTKTTD